MTTVTRSRLPSHPARLFASSCANGVSLNPPRDWQSLERLTRDLFALITGDAHADLVGRTGQSQSGVDVVAVDQGSQEKIGVQCRSRDAVAGMPPAPLSAKEIQDAVEKARAFSPKLDVFVIVTTGPNDARWRKTVAEINKRHRRSGLFELEVHGWDWVEGKLLRHLDLAIQYGLIAAASDVLAPPKSRIAQEIGSRFLAAVAMMNEGRSENDRFTLQSLSGHLGFPDWRKLEDFAAGHADVDSAEVTRIADGLGVNARWLIEGKGAPFFVDPEDYRDADEQFGSIKRIGPRRIIFVRNREPQFQSLVVAEVNDFRWVTFYLDHPMSSHVGGTGRRQLFEYCCLMRNVLRQLDYPGGCYCYGKHVSQSDFMQLMEGRVYPGALFHWVHNDPWWLDFAELAGDRVSGSSAEDEALRDAIDITRGVLAEFQQRSREVEWMRDKLLECGFPVRGRTRQDRYAFDAGLERVRRTADG